MLQFKNNIRIFRNIEIWKITSFKCRPWFLTHSFSLREKLVNTWSYIRRGMARNSVSIAFFNWGKFRGLSTYTYPLSYPHKKSQVDRSGEQAGHGTSPLWERSFPGNNLRNSAIASLELWAVAPSCWNQIRKLFNRRLRNAETRKSRIMAT